MSKIKKMLVSQPAPAVAEKAPFFEVIQKHQLAIDYVPFMHVEGVGIKEFRSQRVEILDHTAVIFTNRTTVDNFFRICEESRIVVPETMKYLCNTEAVALYLQKYIVYRKRKIFFGDGSFTGLMELVLKHKEERFLLALSEPHKPEIPTTLEKLKVRFSPAILARTVSSDLSGVDLANYQMVVMYSPSEVRSFVEQFPAPEVRGDLAIAAFGEGTTRFALASGLTVSVMAPTVEAPSMARAVDLYIDKLDTGKIVPPVVVKTDGGARQADEFVKAHQVKQSRRAKAKKKPSVSSGSGSAAKKG